MAIVVSHPIQHFCPQYSSFAEDDSVELKVFFASTLGFRQYHDPNFGEVISWNNLKLDSFNHEFLNNGEVILANKNIDAPELELVLKNFNPDIVVIYGYFQKLQRRAFKWSKNNKVPIAYISDSERNRNKNRIAEILKYPFLYRFFSQIQYFLTVGDSNEAYYRYYGVSIEKFIRMHFPIDINLYRESYIKKSVIKSTLRACFNIGDEEIVLTVVGKLVEWKNQGDIIDTMILLENEKVILHLFIIGSGKMMEALKGKAQKLTKSKVFFIGFVQPEELPAFYAASDIYIHPASLEPHSLAISEAIFMGCPIIISNKCGSYGPTDDVNIDKNGLVYACGNIKELSEKIKILSADQAMRKRFGETSHSNAQKFQDQSHSGVLKKIRSTIKYV